MHTRKSHRVESRSPEGTIVNDNDVIIMSVTFAMSVSDFISLEGSLDLLETWNNDLYNQSSSMYIQTSNNFTQEVSSKSFICFTVYYSTQDSRVFAGT